MAEKILIVDDGPRVLQIFAKIPDLAGYTALTAPGGEQALQIYERERPSIVLIDMHMPDMDGLVVLRAIRERDPDTEVILISGHSDKEAIVEAMRSGAADLVSKPINRVVLEATLRRAQERLKMKRRFREAQEAFQQAQDELELQIQERAAELAKANQELRTEITERVRAEEALRESEVKYRTLFNSIADPVFVFDQETHRFLDCNQAALNRYGYTLDELRAMTPAQLHPPDEVEIVEKNIDDREDISPHEYTHITKGGDRLQVEIRTDEFEYEGRKAWLSVTRDITKRKRAENALREVLHLLETIFDHTHMMVAYLDPQFNFLRVNRAYAQGDERAPSFFADKNYFDLYPDAEDEAIFRRVVESGETYFGFAEPFEFLEHPEWGVSYWDWSLVPVKDSGGTIEGLLLTSLEVTERVRAERALRESEERLSGFMNSASDSFYLLDSDLNFVEINEKGLEIIGKKRKDVIGKNIVDIVPDIKESGRYEKHLEVIRTGKPFAVDDFIPHPVFGNLHFILKSFKVGDGLGVIASDVTELKRAEERLKEYSERLEEIVEERTRELREAQEQLVRQEKIAMLGQLAGGVAHELRNPLAAINNAAYFLNLVLEDPTPEVKSALGVLEQEVQTSDRIIRSLLDLAYGKPPVKAQVDLNYIIQDALSSIIVPDNIEVTVQLDEALPDILADPAQLRQVFGNIALNAIQAMSLPGAERRGGRLVVKSKALGPESVAVSFADTGVGIAEENLEQLFEPFFTTKAKGIGLGLAISKNLVEANGGSIEVESTLGEGSTFTISLPVSEAR